METVEKKPVVKLIGANGNVFMVIGLCQRAARKAGWTTERWTEIRTKMMSGDYNNVLTTAMDYFDVK